MLSEGWRTVVITSNKKDMFYRIIKQKNMKMLDICAKVLYNNIDLSMRLCT